MTNQDIINEVEPLRAETQKKCAKFGIFAGIFLVLTFIAFAVTIVGSENETISSLCHFLSVLLFGGFFVCIAIYFSISNNFKKKVLVKVKKRIYDKYFPERKEVEDKGMTLDEILYPGFFKHPDRYETSEFMQSSWNGITFRQSKYDLKERHVNSTKNGTTVTYETYAKGTMYFFDFEKELNAVVKVLEKSYATRCESGLKKVETEFMEFNKKFEVRTSDETKVFYLLTPQIQEKIMALEPMFSGQFYMAFIGSDLWIAINDKDSTVPLSLFSKLDDQTLDKLDFIFATPKVFIDNLGLSKDKFKKLDL